MTIFCIGCGDSGKDWWKHHHDISVGCNDAIKHGKDTDYLVLVNGLPGFKHEPERLNLIRQSKAKVLVHSDTWGKIFPKYERLRLQPIGKHLKKGNVYSSKSSPFVAASVAFNLGAENIVLFGVDLVSHHLFNPSNKLQDYEIRNFEKMAKLMKSQGTIMWVSSKDSALSKVLPVWKDYAPISATENPGTFTGIIMRS